MCLARSEQSRECGRAGQKTRFLRILRRGEPSWPRALERDERKSLGAGRVSPPATEGFHSHPRESILMARGGSRGGGVAGEFHGVAPLRADVRKLANLQPIALAEHAFEAIGQSLSDRAAFFLADLGQQHKAVAGRR